MKILLILAACLAAVVADCKDGITQCQDDFLKTNGDLISNQILYSCLTNLTCDLGSKSDIERDYIRQIVLQEINNLTVTESGLSSASIPVLSAMFVTSVAFLTIVKARFRYL